MASSYFSELVACLAFSTLYGFSIAFALAFLCGAGFLIFFLVKYIQESIISSHRPPVVGTIFHQLFNRDALFDYLLKSARKHKTFRYVTPFNSYICTTDPANIEYFMKTNFNNYPKGLSCIVMNDLFGDGIFAVDGEKWKQQRKVASHEFSTNVLKNFSTVEFRKQAIKLAKKFEEISANGVAADMQDLLMKSTMDSLFKVGFGFELDTLTGTDAFGMAFSKAFDESNRIIFCRFVDLLWKWKRRFNIGLEAELKRNLKVIDEFVYKLILRKREQMQNRAEDNVKEDILSRFILASQKDATMTDQYLRDIVLNFLIAGKDTTANTLSWFFYMLCKNPLVQEKIVAEINEVTEFKSDGSIDEFVCGLTEEVLGGMQYLHASLAEALRLFPAVPQVGKSADKDDELPDGFKVKKGDRVSYISYAMGRMTYLWGEDAEDFKPERWLQSGIFQLESPFKFISFNAGPRICLGKDFAYRQMKILAATLLRFFKFKLENQSRIAKYKTMLTLHMDKGLPIVPIPRSMQS